MSYITRDPFDESQWIEASGLSRDLPKLIERGNRIVPSFGDFVGDIFQALTQPDPQFANDNTIPSFGDSVLREIMETKEFLHLRELSREDMANAILSTQMLSETLLYNLQDIPGLINALNQDLPIDDGDDTTSNLTGELRRLFRKSSSDAVMKLQMNEEAAISMGYGSGDGSLDRRTKTGMKEKLSLSDRIKNNPKMKEIISMAGRLRRVALQKRASQVRAIPQEFVGVTMGKDPAKAIPSDLILLANPATRILFFRKMIEGQVLQYEQDCKEKLGMGPILLLVDGSGSMLGQWEYWAKAVTLAYMAIAQKEKRDILVYEFGGEDEKTIREFRYDTKPNEIDSKSSFDLIDGFLNGQYTNFTAPLSWAMNQINIKGTNPWERADIVMITDGEAPVPPDFVSRFNAKKLEYGFNTFGILVGDAAKTKDTKLGLVMDNLYHVKDLNSADEAMKEVWGK